MPAPFKLVRMVRTQSSEIYEARESDKRVAQIDVHYAGEVIFASVQILEDVGEDNEQALVNQVDEEIVASYMPSLARTDLIITVYRSQEIAHYTDLMDDENELFGDDFDSSKN